MSTSNYHSIGLDHEYCQDYSKSGNIHGFKYAIICDGCSQSHESSREVDLGAAMLSKFAYLFVKHIAEKNLGKSEYDKKDSLSLLKTNDFMRYLFYDLKFSEFQRIYGFHEHALDSTLVFAISYNEVARVFVFGDGGFCVEKNNEKFTIKNIYNFEYKSGAPFYLNYNINGYRKSDYGYIYGAYPYFLHTQELIDGEKGELSSTSLVSNEYYSFYFNDFKAITVFSDGVSSFHELNYPVDYIRIVNDLTSFKNYNGNFVYRRVRAAKRQYKKEYICNSDDISLAAIVKDK